VTVALECSASAPIIRQGAFRCCNAGRFAAEAVLSNPRLLEKERLQVATSFASIGYSPTELHLGIAWFRLGQRPVLWPRGPASFVYSILRRRRIDALPDENGRSSVFLQHSKRTAGRAVRREEQQSGTPSNA
jgi:hypothetical protein